jgi:YD repeat-containing protein
MRDGSLLVADTDNCRIRKIDRDGVITTVAGSGCRQVFSGVGDGGPATLAALLAPTKAIEGPDGAIYIADRMHNRVRRVAEDGTIETIARWEWPYACDEGIHYPHDLAFDVDGNLLASSTRPAGGSCQGGTIFELNRDGRILSRIVDDHLKIQLEDEESHLCDGNEFCPVPVFWGLGGIAMHPDGSIVLAQSRSVFRRPPEGGIGEMPPETLLPGDLVTLVAGWEQGYAGDGEPASGETRFGWINGVATDPGGNIFVAESNRVRRIGADGIVTTVAGGGSSLPASDLPATSVALDYPRGLALDPTGETLYMTDADLHQVWKLSLPAISGTNELVVPSEDGSVLYVFDPTGRHLRTEDSITREALWTFRYTTYPAESGAETQLLTEVEDAFGNIVTVERDAEDGEATAIVSAYGQRTELTLSSETGYLREVFRQVGSDPERVTLTTDEDGLLESLKTPKGQFYQYTFDEEGRLIRVNDPEQGQLELDFLETLTGHKVSLTTAEAVSSSTEVSFLPEGGIRQTVTLPTEHEIDLERKKDGSLLWTYPDDTELTVETKPDPRLGAKSPIVSRTRLVTPEERLERIVERERQFSPVGGDELGVSAQTDIVRINGRESTRSYVASTRTLTTTTSEGRTSETVFDTFGRVVEVREPGIETLFAEYDDRGRLSLVRQGSGLEERTVSLIYNEEGFLETVTDPLERETHYEYDDAGRVTKTTLPDENEIELEYDLNGNLIRITPPSRPDHTFTHNDVDQVDAYTSPDLDLETPEVTATTYAYDHDHRLTTITRPDDQQVTVQYDSGGRVDALVSPFGITDLAYDEETGKLESITAPGGASIAYTYEGPWIEEATVAGPFMATVQLEADRPNEGFLATNFWLGRLTINDDDATEIEYEYDDDGQPTRIEEMDLFYDANGRWIGSHVGNTGTEITRSAFGELQRLRAGYFGPPYFFSGQPPFTGIELLDITYERDILGRIERKVEKSRATVDGPQGTRVHEYDYDEDRGWLTEVQLDDVVIESYEYDANGNRTSWSTSFGSGSATYDDQDRLLTYGAKRFTYTENGELLTKSEDGFTTTYTYDVFGNLRAVRLPDGLQIEYQVDPNNRRIAKLVGGVPLHAACPRSRGLLQSGCPGSGTLLGTREE